MSLKIFATQYECTSGAFCATCRNREDGRQLRQGFVDFFDLAEVDFECPHGRPWDYAGSDAPVVSIAQTPCKRRRNPVFVKSSETPDRAQACFECSWFDDVCRVNFPDGIGPTCWDKFLTNAASRCPAGKWQSTLNKDKPVMGIGA